MTDAECAPFNTDSRILGFADMPKQGSWDVRIAFYRTPLEVNSRVLSVTLHLSKVLRQQESNWEVRVYKMQSSSATLISKVQIDVDYRNSETEQTVRLPSPLDVQAGHHVALVNVAGPLKIFEKKLDVASNSGEKIWWSMAEPPNEIGHKMSLKSSANPFRLAWYAEVQSPTYLLGSLAMPEKGTWALRLAFYKDAIQSDGFVNTIKLRLSGALPLSQRVWEARAYSVSSHQGQMMRSCTFRVADTLAEQTIRLRPSLFVKAGEYVAITNPNGVLAVCQQQDPQGPPEAQIFWTDKSPGGADVKVSLKRSQAAYRLGWSAEVSTTDYHHGYPFDAATGSWDIRTAFYTLPAMANGYVNAISLKLSSTITEAQCGWEVRTYKMESHVATMKRRSEVPVDGSARDVQNVRVPVPLYVEEGDYIALVNKAGPLKILQKKLDDSDKAEGIKIWWSAKVPPDTTSERHTMKRSEARYALAWAAEVCRTPRTERQRCAEAWHVGLGPNRVERFKESYIPFQQAAGKAALPMTEQDKELVGEAELTVSRDATTVKKMLQEFGLADDVVGTVGTALAVRGYDTKNALALVDDTVLRRLGLRLVDGDRQVLLNGIKVHRERMEAVWQRAADSIAVQAHRAAVMSSSPAPLPRETAEDDMALSNCTVRFLDNRAESVPLCLTGPAGDAKRRICKDKEWDIPDLFLIFNGRTLDDSQSLAAQGVGEGKPIYCVRKPSP